MRACLCATAHPTIEVSPIPSRCPAPSSRGFPVPATNTPNGPVHRLFARTICRNRPIVKPKLLLYPIHNLLEQHIRSGYCWWRADRAIVWNWNARYSTRWISAAPATLLICTQDFADTGFARPHLEQDKSDLVVLEEQRLDDKAVAPPCGNIPSGASWRERKRRPPGSIR